MLSQLHIENIAVIEESDISFGSGFNVLTGETGAGKSIVIDAISAVLGSRASRDLVRTGTEKSHVTGIFTDCPQLPWFEDNLVPYDDSGELQITREITADGRNSCRVNGKAVSVGVLKTLGTSLIAIHGQHDSQQLFDEQNHLTLLDGFAENGQLLEKYAQSYDVLSDIRRQISALQMDESEKLRRMENLKYQISELESAELKAGEDDELMARRKLLRSAGKLMDALENAYTAINGGDDSDGASALVSEAASELESISTISQELSQLSDRVSELSYTLDDVASELRDLRESYDFSENELDEVESRLDVLQKLKRKYGSTVTDMLEYLEKCRKELDDIEISDDTLKKLDKKLKKQLEETTALANDLTENRKSAARQLEERIMTELAQLDMPKVQFQAEFYDTELTALGHDGVRFLMSANLGEALKPMSKVASGGELARIMLAIKNVLAENDSIPTMIFDEVDAGVSGRAAVKVGAKLKAVSRGRQVLCVTHLPQIAARADAHFCIEKSEHGGRTFTNVTPLDHEGRKLELARLIGGDRITETTLKSAEELMDRE